MQGGARKHGKAEEVPIVVAVPYSSCNCQVVPQVHAYRYTVVGLVIEVPRYSSSSKDKRARGIN